MRRHARWTTAVVGSVAAFALAAGAAADAHSTSTLAAAIETLEEALEAEPTDAGKWIDYGNLLVVAKRPVEARTAYETALDLDPDSPIAHYDLGLLDLESGRARAAIGHFRRALDADPGMARARYALGTAFAARHRHRRAVEQYAAAFALQPELLDPLFNPEILFNPLATWASMKAYLEDSTGRSTRVFANPAPIVGLLLPGVPAPPPPVEAPAETETAGESVPAATIDDGDG